MEKNLFIVMIVSFKKTTTTLNYILPYHTNAPFYQNKHILLSHHITPPSSQPTTKIVHTPYQTAT